MGLAAVRVQRDRNFGYPRRIEGALNDVFGGELHTSAALPKPLVEILGKTTHAAVDVVDWSLEPPASHHGEHRIAPPAMQEWHRARHDGAAAPRQTATLD